MSITSVNESRGYSGRNGGKPMRHPLISGLLMGLFFVGICRAQFQVNTYTSNDQKNAAMAMGRDGSFVAVWSSYGQDGSSNGIFAQRFDPNCSRVGEEFQINTSASGNQTEPAVAMDPTGGFVVTWQGPSSIDDANEDIFARRFDSSGVPLGEEFCVNTHTGDDQRYASATVTSDGTMIVVWESVDFPQEGDRAVCGRRYDASGAKLGGEFIVHDDASVYRYPDVAADASGNFVVAWLHDRRSNSILARLFNADGTAAGDVFEVSTGGFSSVTRPSVAMDPAGFFVVVWDGDPDLAGRDDVHARLFDPKGTPLGESFIVNTTLDGAQQYPHVAMNRQGEFVVVWESRVDPNDANGRDVFGQRFDSLGRSLGDEFQLNTVVEGDQRYPTVALREDGRFVAVWQSYGQDGSRYGIFGETGPQVGSADFNGDGIVDFLDYSVLAGQWRENQNPLRADLIDDNRIDEQDLAEFCRQWLTTSNQ
jgi:hypothetical protein